MKTRFIIPAMFVIGMATAPLMANSTTASSLITEMKVSQESEKVKVDPADLPVPVKEAIEKDIALKALKISEAWKVSDDAASHFVIKFDNEGQELVKKYTALGEVIED
ncbi:hypothetical protein [Cognataquiflexum aquatile]|uniref:hypothetical protein n=1 Tax=Cognataquiflexum aquatile TaxID=2249427 RepID=UPI000DE83B2E|nr:hypothetical protein [Cognataquiflexum aquatile]